MMTKLKATSMRISNAVHMAVLICFAGILAPIPSFAETTIRVSVATDGSQGNSWSSDPAISANGRFVVFGSAATNLVPNDTNLAPDSFVHDLMTGVTSRISVASDGSQSNATPYTWLESTISADGRLVAFTSNAADLVGNDTNGVSDIFVHDRQTGTTVRVSVSSGGVESNDRSGTPKISANGRFVAFSSFAQNLVAVPTSPMANKIFVHDLETAQTLLVSKESDSWSANDSAQYPSISSDGHYIVFDSLASNLVSNDTNGSSYTIGVGRDVFVYDVQTNMTTRVSLASDGSEGNGNSAFPSISGDGRFVTFISNATNFDPAGQDGINQVYLHDRLTGITSLISKNSDGTVGDNDSWYPSISTDGRYVAFWAWASNLGGPAFQVYVHDVVTGQTQWVSRTAAGGGGPWAYTPMNPDIISANGPIVTFYGNNFVDNDTNGESDIFVVLPDDPNALIVPATLHFDGLQAGPVLPQSIVVTNTTASNMTLGSLFTTGRSSRSFSMQDDGCSGKILASGETCTVQVTYAPLSVGAQDAKLIVPFYTQSFSSAMAVVTGSAPDAVFTVSPLFVSFENSAVDATSSPHTVTITNMWNQDFGIETITIGGLSPAAFMLADDQCSGTTVVSMATCTVQIQFTPQALGSVSGVLTIQPQIGPPIDVALNGTGGGIGSGDGGKCFIATAAYGSYLDHHVVALRRFRDSMLLTNSAGRAIVALYYRYSPPAAAMIEKHELFRRFARWVLTPVVYCIQYPWILLLVIALAIFRIVLKLTVRDGRASWWGSLPTRRSSR